MNKNYWIYLSVLLFLLALTAHAQQGGYTGPGITNAQQGGYTGPGAVLTTVVEAKNLPDHSPVILKGKIERFLGDEKYVFSDSSGSITIEIDRRIWGGLSVDHNDLVEITGEIDRDNWGIEVEVRTIKKIQ